MRYLRFIVLPVLLVACEPHATAPVDPPQPAVTANFWLEIPWEMDVCEDYLSGFLNLKWLESNTESASGNTNYKWFINIHGTAVGQSPTNYEYQWNNTVNYVHEISAADGFPYVFHTYDNWVIVGKGKAPNYKYKATVQFTVNANGATTVDFLKEETNCDDLLP